MELNWDFEIKIFDYDTLQEKFKKVKNDLFILEETVKKDNEAK